MSNNKYRVSLLTLIIILFCRHELVALTKFTAMVINEPSLLWLPDSLEQLRVVSAVINSTMAVKYLNEFSGFNSLKLPDLAYTRFRIHSLLKNFHFGERIQEVGDSYSVYTGYVWTEALSGKKKSRIQKYHVTCRRGLKLRDVRQRYGSLQP